MLISVAITSRIAGDKTVGWLELRVIHVTDDGNGGQEMRGR